MRDLALYYSFITKLRLKIDTLQNAAVKSGNYELEVTVYYRKMLYIKTQQFGIRYALNSVILSAFKTYYKQLPGIYH